MMQYIFQKDIVGFGFSTEILLLFGSGLEVEFKVFRFPFCSS